MKRLLCNTLIIMMIMGVCFNGCFAFSGLSFPDRFSYAAADNWSACDSSDLVTAFRYYCKSRNLAIEGSVADALTTFTTNTFNNICSTLGIDPTQLQSELKKTTEGNLGLRFLFSNTGITAYNRIFAEFLQNNDLDVGEEVNDKSVFSGDVFTDDNGNNCLIWNINLSSNSNTTKDISLIQTYGSYLFDSDYIYNDVPIGSFKNYSFDINGTTYSGNLTTFGNASNGLGINHLSNKNFGYNGTTVVVDGVSSYDRYYFMQTNLGVPHGGIAVFHLTNGSYYIGNIQLENNNGTYDPSKFRYKAVLIESNDLNGENVENTNVYVTTNNKTINNNNYNNNYTIIYNEGDTYISDDDDEPLPTTPPGGGGGGNDPGTDDPLAPYDPDKQFPDTPENPTPDPGVHGSPGSDGTITIPDFNFDIPDINWSLDGLQHKFPFSLPFDLYNACKLLNAEPETPELDYTINLVVYDWRVNYDLHWLDPAARVIRIFELLAFVVGLILITRRMIGG